MVVIGVAIYPAICSEYDKVSEPVPVEILEERPETQGTWKLWDFFTGGEPTMHPDLPRIHRTCPRASFLPHKHDLERILLRPELIQTLNQAGLQRMQLSIDGVRRTKQRKRF